MKLAATAALKMAGSSWLAAGSFEFFTTEYPANGSFSDHKVCRRARKRAEADKHTRSVQGTVAWMLFGDRPTAFSE